MYTQEKRIELKKSLIEKLSEWIEEQDELGIYFGDNTISLLAESTINMLEAIKESGEEQEANAG